MGDLAVKEKRLIPGIANQPGIDVATLAGCLARDRGRLVTGDTVCASTGYPWWAEGHGPDRSARVRCHRQ